MKIFLMKSENVQGPERYNTCTWCRARDLSDFIKHTLISVLKTNDGLSGLEQHKGE